MEQMCLNPGVCLVQDKPFPALGEASPCAAGSGATWKYFWGCSESCYSEPASVFWLSGSTISSSCCLPTPLWAWASVVRPAVLRGTSSPTALEMPTGLSACCTAKLQIIDWDSGGGGGECVGFLGLCIPAV